MNRPITECARLTAFSGTSRSPRTKRNTVSAASSAPAFEVADVLACRTRSAVGVATTGIAGTAGGAFGSAGGGGGTVGPVYGAPAAGSGGEVSNAGTANMGGGAMALYGAPPMGGSENSSAGSETGGTGNFPVYGAAPAD